MDFEKSLELNTGLLKPLVGSPFSGLAGFQQQLREVFCMAAAQGWSEIVLSDSTFQDWPLREKSVVESLYVWAKAGRRMTLLATRYDEVLRYQPRFVTWRTHWGHIVDCKVAYGAGAADFPSGFWSSGFFVHRFDTLRSVGVSGDDRESRREFKWMLDTQMLKSTPGFPTSVLGL